jgi:hypothetical protein
MLCRAEGQQRALWIRTLHTLELMITAVLYTAVWLIAVWSNILLKLSGRTSMDMVSMTSATYQGQSVMPY